jgi:hypothetical protein
MNDAMKLDELVGDDVVESFADQERMIGALPDGSHLMELPAHAKWLVVQPDEIAKTLTLKCITIDGRLVTLDPPRREFDGDWKAKWDERARELLSSPSIRRESGGE